MIEPNFDLFLWILLLFFGINAIARIIAGALKVEKSTNYTAGDAVAGLIELFILAWILLKQRGQYYA